MKKIANHKLVLTKQTIAVLTGVQLSEVAGGQRPATKQSHCGDDCRPASGNSAC